MRNDRRRPGMSLWKYSLIFIWWAFYVDEQINNLITFGNILVLRSEHKQAGVSRREYSMHKKNVCWSLVLAKRSRWNSGSDARNTRVTTFAYAATSVSEQHIHNVDVYRLFEFFLRICKHKSVMCINRIVKCTHAHLPDVTFDVTTNTRHFRVALWWCTCGARTNQIAQLSHTYKLVRMFVTILWRLIFFHQQIWISSNNKFKHTHTQQIVYTTTAPTRQILKYRRALVHEPFFDPQSNELNMHEMLCGKHPFITPNESYTTFRV